MAPPRAQRDEAELRGSALPEGSIPNSYRPSQALALRRTLQRSADALSEARLFAKKLISRVHLEKNYFKKNYYF